MRPPQSLILLLLVMALRVSCGDYTNIRREEILKNKADQDNAAKSNNDNSLGMNADAVFHNVRILLTVVFVMSLGAIIYVSKKRFKQSSASTAAPWVTRNAGKPPAPSGSARFR
ncbi:hypothetical protein PRIPAC_85539 [Pristionchus pacificus]|uniref:Uncharacterized protein n=1 Tax=Pristionchus pacificus TaxID=54126 RepID=A0A2A6BNF3_PRIPA|nr:hypothetical protein PRIPAC_85539 [Pristionchus pacificus]|eukprot:PDM67368.1 hypothetical protein PRIPAC_48785 [Pristionchus pacificus]